MEQKIYYVAVAFGTIFQPTIVEKFDNLTDAESYARYAALICCVNSKQNGIALLRRMYDLSRCKRIGFKRGAIPPAAQI